ncbi:hypothetical protein [Pseudosulfitobacter sp. SM2401]|jgi:hypothetical protein|uniref:hypothetical protein n=1 Tax=Pseudosulfitobacter sp. SM2401 TaxID=3350098 RepID=UPI0036F41F88
MAKQSYFTIRDRVFQRLKQTSGKKVAHNHKVATHIGPGATTLSAYLNVLNALPGFVADGVFLAPGEVVSKPSVEDLLTAVIEDYNSRGWLIHFG